jgi:hypothetical protein
MSENTVSFCQKYNDPRMSATPHSTPRAPSSRDGSAASKEGLSKMAAFVGTLAMTLGTRGDSGGKAGRGAGGGEGGTRAVSKTKKLRRTGHEERVANQSSEYTGVRLDKRTGRWQAQCRIGGKKTYLGLFGSEEEAARVWDRMRLWSCKASGRKEEEVQLNFPLSEYSDDEVTALQGCTQEEMIQSL